MIRPVVSNIELFGILTEVSRKSRITISDLKGDTRKRVVSEARQLYFKRAKELTKESLKDIGLMVNRDHSTVLHGINLVNSTAYLMERYDCYFNGKIPIHRNLEIHSEVKSPVKLIIKQHDVFVNPFRDHSICTNQPYMGYKIS
jgi:molybdopterin converting factor small subunit